MDGAIEEQNLKHIKKNKDWLLQELKKQDITDYVKSVAIAEIDSSLQINVLRKQHS